MSIKKLTLNNIKLNRTFLVLFILGSIFLSAGFYLVIPQYNAVLNKNELSDLGSFEVRIPNIQYGLNIDDFLLEDSEVQPNEFFSKILYKCYDSGVEVQRLLDNTDNVFDVRKLRAGKPYKILKSKNCEGPNYLIYEESSYSYIKYDLNSFCAERVHKPVERRLELVEGFIGEGSSLYKSMIDAGVSAYQSLTNKMERALAWSVDFHHLQAGDEYKVYYEKVYVDGQELDAGEIKAAYFKHRNKDFYAFRYKTDELDGYYDEKGHSAKRAFLRAPVAFSRISSRYNKRRYHPVLKRVKAHLGTDYAAPTGTPIMSVADGVVERVGYTKGNGNYVKIRHNKTYQTQYLHMQKFASGIKAGTAVKQGEVIGYVGSTGLATGPHVCFRFWKNGVQVDHLRENLPNTEPMPESEIPKYLEYIAPLMEILHPEDQEEEEESILELSA